MGEYDDLVTRLRSDDENCPFCGRDPYHYVDIGVGFQKAAVECCDLGIGLIQHGDELLVKEIELRTEAATAIAALESRLGEIQSAYTAYKNADADCPARKRSLGDEICPRCGATRRDGCGIDASASYRLIDAVRESLNRITEARP